MCKKTSQTSAGQSSMGVDSIYGQYQKYLKPNLNVKNIASSFAELKKHVEPCCCMVFRRTMWGQKT